MWRIGDRFKYTDDYWFIWEIVDHTDYKEMYRCKIVKKQNGSTDNVEYCFRVGVDDEYLGNFDKSNNFTTLYEKLSRS